jgi:hypothetical protein
VNLTRVNVANIMTAIFYCQLALNIGPRRSSFVEKLICTSTDVYGRLETNCTICDLSDVPPHRAEREFTQLINNLIFEVQNYHLSTVMLGLN